MVKTFAYLRQGKQNNRYIGYSSGFILLELLVALALLFFFVVLALPVLQKTIAQQEIDTAARLLASDLRWLQQVTINNADGSPPRLQFNSWPNSGYYITVDTKVVKSYRFPEAVSTLHTPIVFNVQGRLGLPTQLGTSVVLQNGKVMGLQRQVIVDSAGRIRIDR